MRSALWSGDFPITQSFGVNRHLYDWIRDAFGNPIQGHNGLDLGLWNGTRLYAPGPGEVIATHFDAGGYGWFVRLALDTGEQLVLGHMQRVAVVLHQRVSRGTPLGLSDNTGWSSGPHLHLGYRPPGWEAQRTNGYDGYADPLPWLQALQEEEQEEGEEDMATIAELEAKVAELNSTNSALADQVQALRAEVDHLNGITTTLAEQRDNCEQLKQEVEGDLRQQLADLHARLDAIKQTSRRIVAGAGTLRVQYSDESGDELVLGVSRPEP